jgi:DNA-directed RNA polymerase subunit H (RpoH/RPB5)
MSLAGNLKHFPLPDILQIIVKEKRNGILIVEWKDLIIAYYIKQGQIIFARPVDKITRIYKEKNFPEVLKKLKVKEENIPKILKKYLLQRLGNNEGIFSLMFNFVKYSCNEKVIVPTEQIILEASRLLKPEEVQRKISDEMLTFALKPHAKEVFKKVQPNPVEKKVFELIDGKRTVKEIREALFPTPAIEVDRALYGLWSANLIQRVRRGARQKPQGVTLDLLKKIIDKVKEL